MRKLDIETLKQVMLESKKFNDFRLWICWDKEREEFLSLQVPMNDEDYMELASIYDNGEFEVSQLLGQWRTNLFDDLAVAYGLNVDVAPEDALYDKVINIIFEKMKSENE